MPHTRGERSAESKPKSGGAPETLAAAPLPALTVRTLFPAAHSPLPFSPLVMPPAPERAQILEMSLGRDDLVKAQESFTNRLGISSCVARGLKALLLDR